MMKQISLTVGPEKQLRQLRADNADRKMVLAKSAVDPRKFTLVDISSNPTIFQSQLEYQVLRTIGKSEWQGFLECRYLTLDTDHQKIFNAKLSAWDDPSKRPVGLKYSIVGRDEEKNFEYLMINIWENKDDYIAWKNEKENELKDFGHGGNKQPIVTEFTILG